VAQAFEQDDVVGEDGPGRSERSEPLAPAVAVGLLVVIFVVFVAF